MTMDLELREPTFFVLTALADGPRHGYGVIQEVEHLSGGRTRLRAGTLYAAFDRLSAHGLIEVEREKVVEGRLRRYCRLTESGILTLGVESRRRMTISKEALRRPKNPGSHIGNVVVGILLIGLCVLLKTWSRFLSFAVMGSLVVLMSTNFVNAYTLSEVNVVVPLVLLVIPLVLSWP
jgi:PadR family transcriptional regulator PadR